MKKIIPIILIIFILTGCKMAGLNPEGPPTAPTTWDSLKSRGMPAGFADDVDDGAGSASVEDGVYPTGWSTDDTNAATRSAIYDEMETKQDLLSNEAGLYSALSDVSLFLEDLVDDTTPQLGGNLDIQAYNIEGVDATEFGYVDGVTSDIQTQLNAKEGTLTNEAGLYAALSDVSLFLEDFIDDTTPQAGGDLDLNGNNLTDATGRNDDDCTGDQGKFWWDSTDNQWEGCNANSGTPLVLGSGAGTDEPTVEGYIFDSDAELISGVWEVQDDTLFNFGDDADFGIRYDETTDDQLEIVSNSASTTTIDITNSGAGVTDLTIDGKITATGGMDLGANTTAKLGFEDSDCPGADKDVGNIEVAYVDGADGSENADMIFRITQGGTEDTEIARFDESDDQWETTKNVLVPTEVYDATNWNGDMTVPTKDAVRDKIEGLAGTGTMTTVEDGDSQVGGADIVTLDFDGTVFNLTESPDTEINIDIADDGLDSQHYAGASVDPEHVSIGAWDFGTSAEADTLTEGGNAVWNSTETEIIDSDHYVDGSIDPVHLANQVRSEFIPIGWFVFDGTTDPGDETEEDNIRYRDFDTTTAEEGEFIWKADEDLSGSTIKVRAIAVVTNATTPADTEGVSWGIAACSSGTNDTHDCTVGTEVNSEDADLDDDAGTQWDIVVFPYVEVTPTALAAGELVKIAVQRDTADADDDYGQDIGLIGVDIKYQTNPGTMSY